MRVWDSGWQRINTVFKSLLLELRSLIKVDKTPRAIIFGVEGLSPSVVPNLSYLYVWRTENYIASHTKEEIQEDWKETPEFESGMTVEEFLQYLAEQLKS